MACSTYNIEFLNACLVGNPGVARLYISDYYNVLTSTINADGVTLTGLTCTGQTAMKSFYQVELLTDAGAVVNTPTITVANGVALSMPDVKFKIPQLSQKTLQAFYQLINGRTVVVWENMDGVLFITGLKRGLFATSGTEGSTETDFEGITVELKGKEKVGNYILSPDLQTSFVTTFVS